jgi:hypothetical protein
LRARPAWWLLLFFGIPLIYVASAALKGNLSA